MKIDDGRTKFLLVYVHGLRGIAAAPRPLAGRPSSVSTFRSKVPEAHTETRPPPHPKAAGYSPGQPFHSRPSLKPTQDKPTMVGSRSKHATTSGTCRRWYVSCGRSSRCFPPRPRTSAVAPPSAGLPRRFVSDRSASAASTARTRRTPSRPRAALATHKVCGVSIRPCGTGSDTTLDIVSTYPREFAMPTIST